MITETRNLNIVRDRVHIVPNNKGGIYEVTDEVGKLYLTIEQNEIIFNNRGHENIVSKRLIYKIDVKYITEGNLLPGNIHTAYQTVPIKEDDPEYGLLWRDGKVVRTKEGKAIYTYNFYCPDSNYQPTGDINEPLPK